MNIPAMMQAMIMPAITEPLILLDDGDGGDGDGVPTEIDL